MAESAFEPVVSKDVFHRAQQKIRAKEEDRARKHSREEMLAKLSLVYEQYGTVTRRLIHSNPDMVAPGTYVTRFASVDQAYQSLFAELIERKKTEVLATLKQEAIAFECIDDLIRLKMVAGNGSTLPLPEC